MRAARLSRRMMIPYRWPTSSTKHAQPWENPNIPSGYTYFLQFVAHDCIHSSVPTSALSAHVEPARNRRSNPLTLETLYGGGFDGCLNAIGEDEQQEAARSKLPLGQIRQKSVTTARCPFRDISRAASAQTSGRNTALQKVLIPDDRNDNNVFVSQTTVLFSIFHNTIVDLIRQHRSHRQSMQNVHAYLARLFVDAQKLTMTTYRAIIRDDLMRRILHPLVYSHYASDRPQFISDGGDDHVPLEFAQALRFGHAMVRPHYRVNDVLDRREELLDVLLTTSRGRPWRLPLDESWAVQWSKFFELGVEFPNWSRRIGPSFSVDLMSNLVFDTIDETNCVGLIYRDILNSALAPGWSLPALVSELQHRAPQLVRSSRLLMDVEFRHQLLRSWLEESRQLSGLTDGDIQEISQDPPLLLFILFEAAYEMQGAQLGILGSILIGDVIFRLLVSDNQQQAAAAAEYLSTARRMHCSGESSLFNDRIARKLGCVRNMSGFVQFIHEFGSVDDSAIPFV